MVWWLVVLVLVLLGAVVALVMLVRSLSNQLFAARIGAVGSHFHDVGDFHEKFGLDSVTHCGFGPRDLPYDVVAFRSAFMREELEEFQHAAALGDQAKTFDALIDLVYVALGTAHLMGFPWQAGWQLVQQANLAKVRAAGSGDPRSKRGHALDVVKPSHWTPPDIEGLLRRLGWPSAEV